MTIKLFDVNAQKDYDQSVKDFHASPAPVFSEYPKPPEPFLDSQDPGITQDANFSPLEPVCRDLRPHAPSARDGSSLSEVKGHDTHWSAHKNAPNKPFALKK